MVGFNFEIILLFLTYMEIIEERPFEENESEEEIVNQQEETEEEYESDDDEEKIIEKNSPIEKPKNKKKRIK